MSKKTYKHICDRCGKEYEISSSVYHRLQDGRQKHSYCSKECKNAEQQTGHDVKCDYCGKIFHRRQYWIDKQNNNGGNVFCSPQCQYQYKSRESVETRICEICGNSFITSKVSTKRFCSNECQGKWQSTQIGELNPRYKHKKVICSYCGNEFMVKNFKAETRNVLLCSTECRQSWFREIHAKDEDYIDKRRKIAVSNLVNGVYSKTDSKPQQIVDSLLFDLNIKNTKEYNIIYYSIDNYLDDYNLMIEVQGDYWHCNPSLQKPPNDMQKERIVKDKAKHTYVYNKYGIQILYLWEYDLINNIDLCKKMILEYIETGGKLNTYHSFNYNKTMHIKTEY